MVTPTNASAQMHPSVPIGLQVCRPALQGYYFRDYTIIEFPSLGSRVTNANARKRREGRLGNSG